MNKQLLSALALSSLLVACGDDNNSSNNQSQKIAIDFAAKINSADLLCDENTETVGTAQTAANIKYFGLYVSDLAVASATGDFMPVTLDQSTTADVEKGISLLAFCGTDLKNSTIAGTVANNAEISRVRFTVGVPEKYNHLDATKTEGILSKEIAMHWSWTKGYKHMRMDVAGWKTHIGSTACSSENTSDGSTICDKGNRPTYTLENLDLSQDQIEFDYAVLVNNVDVSITTNDEPRNCMSSSSDVAKCDDIFTALGLDLATGSCKNNDCDSQTWVSSSKK